MSKHPFLHDHFFRSIFQIKEVALEHVQDYVPPELAAFMDLNNFQLDPTVYVSEKLKEKRSDLVYKCPVLTGLSLIMALLHEHKSKQPELDIRLQILDYKTSIWKKDEMQQQPLTFVLPSVIYNGKKKWDKQPFRASFPGLPKELLPFLAEFDYLLLNLPAITDGEIIKRSEGKLLSTAFLAMKHGHEPDYFKKNFQKILNFDFNRYSAGIWQTFYQAVLSYISNITGFTSRDLSRLAKQLPQPLNDFTMLTMEPIFEEGKREGKREGKIEGKIEGKREGILIGREEGMEKHAIKVATELLSTVPEWADGQIAKIADLPVAEVAKLRAELKNMPKKGKNGTNKK